MLKPFDMENVSATYQKLINTMFNDLIGSKVEAYRDDMVVKASHHPSHLKDLQVVFDQLP